MFKFGDYTLQEVAEKWDCDEELILAALKDKLDTRRQYLFFGPILFKRAMVDNLIPYMRSSMRSHIWTRAEGAQHKQGIADLKAQNEQSRKSTEENWKRMREEHEAFLHEMIERAHRHVSPSEGEPPADESK
jgi:hypothetical protein